MPVKSKAEFRFMAAVEHDPKFAKKVGVKPAVGKEFVHATKRPYKALPARAKSSRGARGR